MKFPYGNWPFRSKCVHCGKTMEQVNNEDYQPPNGPGQ